MGKGSFSVDQSSISTMPLPAFAAWAAMYDKTYNGDEAAREAIYNANVKWIEENNSDGTQGLSPFMDLTQDEFRAQYLTLKTADGVDRTDAYLGRHYYSGAELPSEVDWSTQGAVTAIKNQGSCGSCWAFSTTGSLEGRTQIAQGTLPTLSEQQFVDCDTDFGDQGCNGGLMDNAFKYAMQSGGVCTEGSYSYTGKGGSCAASSCTVGLKNTDITGFKDVDNSEEALAEAVSQGPVSVAVDALRFQLYFGGILSGICGAQLDHGVLAVGYGEASGTKYWKVKNSWGASWGEKGYIRLLKGKSGSNTGECGIRTSASYPVIASSVTV